jgi:hypothetical protein
MRTVAVLVAALVLIPAAGAKDGVRATLTTPLPQHASAGTKLVVTFTLRDATGHPFNAGKVFVKVICPTKDATSIAFASRSAHPTGRYRVVAIVPPGGLGTIRIGLRGSTDIYFPIKNH